MRELLPDLRLEPLIPDGWMFRIRELTPPTPAHTNSQPEVLSREAELYRTLRV